MHLFLKYTGLLLTLWLLLPKFGLGQPTETICNRYPLGTNTPPLPADDTFVIDIKGVDKQYIPSHNYTIRLYSRDNKTSFIAFTISARGSTKPSESNPRKIIPLNPGRILSSPYTDRSDTIVKDECPNTVFQANTSPKTYVEAFWQAPPKEQQCVSIYAYVAIKPDVWYSSDGPLSKQVCEDRRKADDMPPKENDNCQVCEEARYQLTFEGTWSYNTHPKMFPKTQELAKFSDIVGASHSRNYNLYKSFSDASAGLKMLAEQKNTSKLEVEILEQLGTNVRTLIKATGPPKPNMSTMTSFRVSRDQHLVSLVSAIIPSPDWFLGVPSLELCDESNQWARSVRLNLYPSDAGTDSGLTFESPNEETSPPQPITSAEINNEVPKELTKPFAKLKIELIRTYSTPNCMIETTEDGDEYGGGQEPEYTYRPPVYKPPPPVYKPPVYRPTGRTSEAPPAIDPNINSDCLMTPWEDWLPCEGECVDGTVVGYQTRFRYPVVNGIAVGKSFDKETDEEIEIPEHCLEEKTTETRRCKEDCEEPTEEPEPESRVNPIRPGFSWNRGK